MQKIIFITIGLFLLVFILMSTLFKRKHKIARHYNKITVTGNTCNIAGRAAVVGDSTGTYFVEGMEKWEESWLNHTVRVTGDLADSKKTIKAADVRLLNREY